MCFVHVHVLPATSRQRYLPYAGFYFFDVRVVWANCINIKSAYLCCAILIFRFKSSNKMKKMCIFDLFVRQMSFKVVQLEKKNGQLELAAVPTGWEKDNILFWPVGVRNSALFKDPNSVPQTAGGKWQRYNCEVKRKDLETYEQASAQIDLMENESDTCLSDGAEESKKLPARPVAAQQNRPKRRTCVPISNPDLQRNNFNEVVSIERFVQFQFIFFAKIE